MMLANVIVVLFLTVWIALASVMMRCTLVVLIIALRIELSAVVAEALRLRQARRQSLYCDLSATISIGIANFTSS